MYIKNESYMRKDIRRKLSMAARALDFAVAHPSTDVSYNTLVGRLKDRLAWAENFLQCRGWTSLLACDRLVLGPVFARLARDAKCVADAAGDLAVEMSRP